MHPVDPILLFAIANVVAWPTSLYIDNDGLQRIVGHMVTCTVGSVTAGLTAQWFYPETMKISLMLGAFAGAIALLYLVRYRKWR